MIFALNHATDRPIYAQIGDRIKFGVVAGLLKPGQMVPSVRELSKQLVVNPNTVARAYRDLQGEGILDSVRGTGLAVMPAAVEICRRDRREYVRRRLREAITEVKQSGLPTLEVEAILRSEWAEAGQGLDGHAPEAGAAGTATKPNGADQ